MELTQTAKLLEELREARMFGSYGVIVGYRGEEAFLHSEDVDLDTYFDIASMGKVLVTTTLIFKSIDAGMLTLDDTLDMFFGNVPDEKKKITVKQLLTHSSGILRYQIPAEVAALCTDRIVEFILSKPLGYTPGTGYQYSCAGFLLLGYILEKLHKKTLDELFFLWEKAPLGLTRARFNIALDEPNSVFCYRWQDRRNRVMDDEIISVLRNGCGGNGGEFWSPGDIRRYVKLVMERSPLLWSRGLFDLSEVDHNIGADGVPFGVEGRGLGWLYVDGRYAQTGKLFPRGSFGHCGHCGQSIYMNRELDLYVIILSNATRYAMIRNDWKGYDYGEVCRMRATIHDAIADELAL